MDSSIGNICCRKSNEQTDGTQRPKVRPVPFFGLKIVNSIYIYRSVIEAIH